MAKTDADFPMNEDTENEIFECFSLFDTNKCGYIDIKEFYFALKALGLNMKKKEVINLFLEIKTCTEDKLNLEEFFTIVSKNIYKRYNEKEMDKIFSLFDPNDTGKITMESLRNICAEVGENFSNEELNNMIEYADENNDKAIDRNEFRKVLLHAWRNDPLSDIDSE